MASGISLFAVFTMHETATIAGVNYQKQQRAIIAGFIMSDLPFAYSIRCGRCSLFQALNLIQRHAL